MVALWDCHILNNLPTGKTFAVATLLDRSQQYSSDPGGSDLTQQDFGTWILFGSEGSFVSTDFKKICSFKGLFTNLLYSHWLQQLGCLMPSVEGQRNGCGHSP